MAGMSSADTTYTDAMTTMQKSKIAAANAYLTASPGDRRANLSDQARNIIETSNECCCNGVGCCCCANGCCYDGPCGTCKAGCGCSQEPAATAKATF